VFRAILDEREVQPTSNFGQRAAGAEKRFLDKFELRDRCRRMCLTVVVEHGKSGFVKEAKSPIWRCEGGKSSFIARFRQRYRNRHVQEAWNHWRQCWTHDSCISTVDRDRSGRGREHRIRRGADTARARVTTTFTLERGR
jgi:hypothetical protein